MLTTQDVPPLREAGVMFGIRQPVETTRDVPPLREAGVMFGTRQPVLITQDVPPLPEAPVMFGTRKSRRPHLIRPTAAVAPCGTLRNLQPHHPGGPPW